MSTSRIGPLDWKFWLTTALTLLGIVVMAALWQLDRSQARPAITLSVLSTSGLSAGAEPTAIEGVVLSVDGKAVVEPFVSVIRLENKGSRPIQSSDFETPISIATTPTEVVKAAVKFTVPPDLRPDIRVDGGKLILRPLLLNPGDSVTVSLLTSGGSPAFSPAGRIAGVQSIETDSVHANRQARQYLARAAVSVALLTLYIQLFLRFRLLLRRRHAWAWMTFVQAIAAGCGGTFLAFPPIPTSGTSPALIWEVARELFLRLLPATALAVALEVVMTKREKRAIGKAGSEPSTDPS
jgi:hypothetical protein